MDDTKPKTVTVEALQPHTYNGKAYEVGQTYEIDEQYVDSVQTQGKAIRVDRVEKAKAEQKAAETKPAKALKTKKPAKKR